MNRDTTKTIGVALLLHAAFTVGVPWIIVRQTQHVPWLNLPFGPVRWIGLVGIAFGLYLYCSAFLQLIDLKTSALPGQDPTRLAVSGWYTVVRHPLLLGVVLILLGEAVAFHSLPLLFFALLYWVGLDRVARKEERDLERVFGDAYTQYAANVPRWIPGWLSTPRDEPFCRP